MSRLKQNQNIDRLIHCIESIAENRCSLSEGDLTILNNALVNLTRLRRKKGKTNDEVLTEVVPVVGLMSRFFIDDAMSDNESDE